MSNFEKYLMFFYTLGHRGPKKSLEKARQGPRGPQDDGEKARQRPRAHRLLWNWLGKAPEGPILHAGKDAKQKTKGLRLLWNIIGRALGAPRLLGSRLDRAPY